MQTAASKGRWVIIEVDPTGRETVVDRSASAVSRPLRPHERRRLIHELITYQEGDIGCPTTFGAGDTVSVEIT